MKMVDTHGGNYAIVPETRQIPDSNVLFVEDESQDFLILLLDDKQGDLCSFKAVRKVHKINRHIGKDQLITVCKNAGWMSPDLVKIIDCVVNDCRFCQSLDLGLLFQNPPRSTR